jgi:gamma-glutamyltranspeptidase/glutathione hydrolase
MSFTTRPEILGTFGVATSTHWIASAVGMSLLEKLLPILSPIIKFI